MKGLDAEAAAVAAARKQEAAAKQQAQSRKASYEADLKAYEVREREFNKAAKAYTDCQLATVGAGMKAAMQNPRMMQMAEAMMKLPAPEREAFQQRMTALQKRMQAAEKAGDVATATRLKNEADADFQKTLGIGFQDMQAAGTQAAVATQQAQQQGAAQCGQPPVEPVRPVDPSEVQVDVRDSVRVAAKRASGLSAESYAILRERVAAWLASKEEKRSLDRYGFTDAEIAVLTERHAALKARKGELLATDHVGGWFF